MRVALLSPYWERRGTGSARIAARQILKSLKLPVTSDSKAPASRRQKRAMPFSGSSVQHDALGEETGKDLEISGKKSASYEAKTEN